MSLFKLTRNCKFWHFIWFCVRIIIKKSVIILQNYYILIAIIQSEPGNFLTIKLNYGLQFFFSKEIKF